MLLDEGARYRRYRRRHHLYGVGAGCDDEPELGCVDKAGGKDGSGSAPSWSGPLPQEEARCDDEGVDVRDSTSEMTASCRIDDSFTAIIARDEDRRLDCGSGSSNGGLWARLSACYCSLESSGCGRCDDVRRSEGHSSEEHAGEIVTSTIAPPATPAISTDDITSAMQHIFTHGVVHYCLNRSSVSEDASAAGDCSSRHTWSGYQPLAPAPWEGAIVVHTAGQDLTSLPLSPIASTASGVQPKDAIALPPPPPSPSSVCRSF